MSDFLLEELQSGCDEVVYQDKYRFIGTSNNSTNVFGKFLFSLSFENQHVYGFFEDLNHVADNFAILAAKMITDNSDKIYEAIEKYKSTAS